MQAKPAAVLQVIRSWFEQSLNGIGMPGTQGAQPVVEPRLDTGTPDQQGRTVDADSGNHHPIISHEIKLCDNRS